MSAMLLQSEVCDLDTPVSWRAQEGAHAHSRRSACRDIADPRCYVSDIHVK